MHESWKSSPPLGWYKKGNVDHASVLVLVLGKYRAKYPSHILFKLQSTYSVSLDIFEVRSQALAAVGKSSMASKYMSWYSCLPRN